MSAPLFNDGISHGKYGIQSAPNIAKQANRVPETRPYKGLTDFRRKIVVDRSAPKSYTDDVGVLFDFIHRVADALDDGLA